MKVYLFLIISLFLISCSDDSIPLETEDLSISNYPPKWNLFKMTGMLAGSEATGEDMQWQEYYIFRSDNTFIKTRVQDGETLIAKGTYETREIDDIQNYLLQHNTESSIIGNCTGNLEENLYISDDGKILLSSWWACDGPGLFYSQENIK
ncbi:hypothetical protein [Christiangramia forsetii]|uniref:Uncharacterized protein n=2 Tax=Christiangramia forsetii TaxID=411153 RepID=A0LYZ5_CHRFK|nr:hypothetical protein [Christiangramia forsetii]GGG37011.1 hypothetical protein GCM10011532_20880 [Christiangramia forsetii]CAL65590.1 hypothetical protein GFO_0612 [Christiangramia forsetii KT0803]